MQLTQPQTLQRIFWDKNYVIARRNDLVSLYNEILTTGFGPMFTFLHISIISSASRAIHFAWLSQTSGKPDTAMYLSPTVSTWVNEWKISFRIQLYKLRIWKEKLSQETAGTENRKVSNKFNERKTRKSSMKPGDIQKTLLSFSNSNNHVNKQNIWEKKNN